MIVTKTQYTSIWSSGSRTHQRLPRRVSAPRLRMSASTRERRSRRRERTSSMPSRISRRAPGSPAALRNAAGTSDVADIARKGTTVPRPDPLSPRRAEEPVDEAVARTAVGGTHVAGDEGLVGIQVEPVGGDRLD